MKTFMKSMPVLFVLIVGVQSAFSQKIILHHLGNVSLFSTFESAVSAAQAGDTLYLPGGIVNCSTSSPTINKLLHIIGTGHYPDSTVVGCTNFFKPVYITTGASQGSLQGCTFNQTLCFGSSTSGSDSVENYYLSRCRINGLTLGLSSPCNVKNLYISECVIQSSCNFHLAENCFLEKNIITNYNNCAYLQNAELWNNVIYGTQNFVSSSCNFCLFKNNILVNTTAAQFNLSGSNEFIKNLFCTLTSNNNWANVLWNSNVNNGNIVAQLASDTFINALTSTFSYENNYHLIAGCPGINYGDDGTDVGIYGTSIPYKEGAIPANPHIVSKSINSGTNPSTGFLHLDITVSSQNY